MTGSQILCRETGARDEERSRRTALFYGTLISRARSTCCSIWGEEKENASIVGGSLIAPLTRRFSFPLLFRNWEANTARKAAICSAGAAGTKGRYGKKRWRLLGSSIDKARRRSSTTERFPYFMASVSPSNWMASVSLR